MIRAQSPEQTDKVYAVSTQSSVSNEKSQSTERGGFKQFFRDFKPVELLRADENLSREEKALFDSSHVPLKLALKARHVEMIAFGGAIGAGLFIGSGNSLQAGGPGGILIGYSVMAIFLFSVMSALCELGVRYPMAGVFAAYNSRFIHMSWGFAIGWNYTLGCLVSLPAELIAAADTISFWDSDNNGAVNVNRAAWVALFFSFIVFINIFGTRGYGEMEFVLSIIKVATIIGFIFFGIIASTGHNPNHIKFGTEYWRNPGSFPNGAKGVISVLVSASYAYSGSEMVAVAAMESEKPHITMPRVTRQVFWRIIIFYIVSITIVCSFVPSTDEHLGTDSTGNSSPFVLAIRAAGVKGLPSVVNTVIILAALSVGNSSVYASTRTVVSLAAQGHAPRVFLYIDRKGRPVAATAVALAFGLIGFVCAAKNYSQGFTWLSDIGGLSVILVWGSVCVCHVRHRLGMRAQGIPLSDLEYRAPLGIYGSVVGILITAIVLGLSFWVALFPLGSNGVPSRSDFFQTWMSAVIIIAFLIPHLLYFRDPWRGSSKVDVTSHLRIPDHDELLARIEHDKQVYAAKPLYYKFYRFFC